MEIILLKEAPGLGQANELKTVKNGYAMNYLIPQGIAIVANKTNMKIYNARMKSIEKKNVERKALAENWIKQLKKETISIGVKSNETGKIFGSITTLQLSKSLKERKIDIGRNDIEILDENIKTLGTYAANLKFHEDITETINFEVVQE